MPHNGRFSVFTFQIVKHPFIGIEHIQSRRIHLLHIKVRILRNGSRNVQ